MRNLTPSASLPCRHLRGLNRDVPVIGAGCWTIGGPCVNDGVDMGWSPAVDDRTAELALRTAYECGVRLYDTADVYGHGLSERRLGKLLATVPRDTVTVISKVGYRSGDGLHPYHPAQMRRQLTTTLANLGTDYLDLYAFHSGNFGPDDRYLVDAAATMRTFLAEGLVRAVGMRAPHEFAVEWASHPHTPEGRQVARFLTLFNRLQPQIVAVRHNMLSPTYGPDETDVFAFARANGTGVLIKQVLGQGLLVTAQHADRASTLGQGDHRATKSWFSPQGRRIIDAGLDPLRRHFGTGINALVAVAIRYALQTAPNAIALIGFRTAEQIGACTRDLVPDLTQDEIELVRRVGQQMRAALDKAFGSDARQTTPAQPAKGKQ